MRTSRRDGRTRTDYGPLSEWETRDGCCCRCCIDERIIAAAAIQRTTTNANINSNAHKILNIDFKSRIIINNVGSNIIANICNCNCIRTSTNTFRRLGHASLPQLAHRDRSITTTSAKWFVDIPLPSPVARVVAIHDDQTAARPLRREIGRNLRPLSRLSRERSVTALDAKAFPNIAAATQSEYD